MKAYEVSIPISEEARLLSHFARLGLGQMRDGRVHVPQVVTRVAHHAPAAVFTGRIGGTRLQVRLRKRSQIEVRVTFTPQMLFRRAWRIILQLGLHPTEGAWL